MSGSVYFVICDPALGAPLITARYRLLCLPDPLSSWSVTFFIYVSLGRAPGAASGSCSFDLSRNVLRACAEVWESQGCFAGVNSLVFRHDRCQRVEEI